MKKLFVMLVLLLIGVSVSAGNEELEKLYYNTFYKDHNDYKDARTNVKLLKAIGKMYPGYYDEKNQFSPSKEDLDNGYSVYAVNSVNDIYPNSRPSAADLKRPLSCAGTPGEFKPLTLCVLPQSDLSSISVSITELKGPGGVIPAENLSVRHVKYEYTTIGVQWFVTGRYLLKGAVDGYAGVPRMFWITVKLPEAAAPGIYKGEVTVFAGKKPVKLPVSAEVFPFKFAEWSENETYWMWYYKGYPENTWLEKDMQNLREHGMNCFDSGDPFPVKYSGGKLTVDFSVAERIVPLLRKHGFTSWMFDSGIQADLSIQTGGRPWSPAHRTALKEFARLVAEKAKTEKWPRLIFTFDEPREEVEAGKLRDYISTKNTFEILNAEGLITNASWATWGGFPRLDDKSKIADYSELCYLPYFNTTHAAFPPSQKLIDKVNELKKPLLLYNCGNNRFAFGFLTYQSNALGNSKFWWGQAQLGNPTSQYASSSCAVYGKEGPVDTTDWENIREGVYDYRYFRTLEKAIAENPQAGSGAVKTAKAILAAVKDFQIASGTGTGLESDFMREAMKNFKGADKMDELKYKAAQSIIALQGVKK